MTKHTAKTVTSFWGPDENCWFATRDWLYPTARAGWAVSVSLLSLGPVQKSGRQLGQNNGYKMGRGPGGQAQVQIHKHKWEPPPPPEWMATPVSSCCLWPWCWASPVQVRALRGRPTHTTLSRSWRNCRRIQEKAEEFQVPLPLPNQRGKSDQQKHTWTPKWLLLPFHPPNLPRTFLPVQSNQRHRVKLGCPIKYRPQS